MADRPIIMSAPSVRSILAGRKVMTRRIVTPRGSRRPSLFDGTWSDSYVLDPGNAEWRTQDVLYAPGDRLWVREAWGHDAPDLDTCRRGRESDGMSYGPYYMADANWIDNATIKRLSPIHMPRWASRLTLTVTEVRVERLTAISAADSIAEGAECSTCAAMDRSACVRLGCFASIQAFLDAWNSLHGPGAWERDPWVVAIRFEAHPVNIDRMEPNHG